MKELEDLKAARKVYWAAYVAAGSRLEDLDRALDKALDGLLDLDKAIDKAIDKALDKAKEEN